MFSALPPRPGRGVRSVTAGPGAERARRQDSKTDHGVFLHRKFVMRADQVGRTGHEAQGVGEASMTCWFSCIYAPLRVHQELFKDSGNACWPLPRRSEPPLMVRSAIGTVGIPRVSLADFGCVGGPVPIGELLPLDGGFDVDAEHVGQDRGGDLGGEHEQRGVAALAGL